MRLDQYLVLHHHLESRTKAQDLIRHGKVMVNNRIVTKSGYEIQDKDSVQIIDSEILKYVSRAGLKLEGAFQHIQSKSTDLNKWDISGKIGLDVGQATGGFTDCCLAWGAQKIIGVDVGEGQLHAKIKMDSRVQFFEKLNIKDLSTNKEFLMSVPTEGFDFVVCDVSFISITHVMPHFARFLKSQGEYLLLVKPQFECGPDNLNKNGIVTNSEVHQAIQMRITQAAQKYLGKVEDYFESSVSGKDGNREFFILGKKT